MHRYSSWIFLFAALYVSGPACATDAPAVVSAVPALPAASAVPAQSAVPAVAIQPAPHIALLLPLKSPTFGHAADVVRQGFMAAASTQPQALPIRVYEMTDERKEVAALYQLAVASGARAVVGPLTRDGVATIASGVKVTVPMLALNAGESKDAVQLHFFGLPPESEARQIAQFAAAAKMRYATIVSTGTPLSKRLVQAFTEEWKSLGKSITAEVAFTGDTLDLAGLPTAEDPDAPASSVPVLTLTSDGKLDAAASGVDAGPPPIAPGNMVFLAADAEKAQTIRPYLNVALPIYTTSQVFRSNADTLANFELNNIRFVDMPWLLQPDHPAVMIYPRANPPLTPDMERLYAFGIDAFRLLQIMQEGNLVTALPLDGVSGRLHQGANRQFQREAIPAILRQGRSQVLDTAGKLPR